MAVNPAWSPLLGAILGAVGAGIYFGASNATSPFLAALATVAFWTALAPPAHEGDRLPTLGILGLIASVAARGFALSHIRPGTALAICVASQAVPRAATVALAWMSRPAAAGRAHDRALHLQTPAAMAAITQGVLAALLSGLRLGIAIVLGSYLIARLTQELFYRRRGGVDAGCLGLTDQLLQILILSMGLAPSVT